LLAALLALSLPVAAAVAAKPRGGKRHKVRGKVTRVHRAHATGWVAWGTVSRVPRSPAPTPTPTPTPSPAPGDPGGDPPPPPPPPLPTGSASALQVRTDDSNPDRLKLVLSRTSVTTGKVKVEFNNGTAQDPHNLVLEPLDASGDLQVFGELAKGEVTTKTVTLGTGTWKVYCALLDHEAKGMTATLTVAP
jgi:hypothetical protein